ncbi:MAG: hypothetical protein J6T22_09475 [Bacteroidales bacterium]|nr:hypothetical protein [Bacteroidales bacterium]MBO7617424.1 hypothetical protein [Bacteroidales bacterium]
MDSEKLKRAIQLQKMIEQLDEGVNDLKKQVGQKKKDYYFQFHVTEDETLLMTPFITYRLHPSEEDLIKELLWKLANAMQHDLDTFKKEFENL